MAYKTFANGFPLPASDLNNFLMNQSVIVFANSTARDAALPTPTEGMLTYLEDTNLLEVYNGSAWSDINDNTAAIPKSTVTTAGDLIVADGASSVTRLGVGTADQVLTTDGTDVSWSSPNYVPAPGTDDQVLTLASGVPVWADAASGGTEWNFLALSSIPTGGTTATVSFTSGYDKYAFAFADLSATAAGSWSLQVQDSSGALAVHRITGQQWQGASTTFLGTFVTSTNFEIAYSRGAAERLHGNLYLEGASAGRVRGTFSTGPENNLTDNYGRNSQVLFNSPTNTGVNSIQFTTSSGTVDAGTILIYGA